jgi:osmoprotectant transport system substrate-binding protein
MTLFSKRRGVPALLTAVLALGFSACGSDDDGKSSSAPASTGSTAAATAQPGKGKPPVTLGAKNFTEQYILGELYGQALKAKGFSVTVKSNIGSSEITDKALTSGKIDLYPEYTGTILTAIAKMEDRPRSAEEAYELAKAFEAERGFTTLDKTPFFNADGLAVLPDYAEKHGLKTIADLAKAGSFAYGAPPENKTRFQGLVGMKQEYGLDKVKFRPLAIGLQYKALDSRKIDVAAIFTTDGQLQGGKYTVLEDPKGVFGYQNVTPVVNAKVLAAQGPEFAATLDAVSAKLTTEAMQQMNAAVDLDKAKPAAVAKAFLDANGLLEG